MGVPLAISNSPYYDLGILSQSENKSQKMNNELNKFISKKKVWCASSTHPSEEVFCGLVHKSLKKKYKNLLTIIIPRHINRISEIK